MTQRTNSQLTLSATQQPAPTFQSLLAIGAMLAALAVVAYSCLQSDDSVVRVHSILQGAEVILLTGTAGLAASALHWISLVGETLARKTGIASERDAFEM